MEILVVIKRRTGEVCTVRRVPNVLIRTAPSYIHGPYLQISGGRRTVPNEIVVEVLSPMIPL